MTTSHRLGERAFPDPVSQSVHDPGPTYDLGWGIRPIWSGLVLNSLFFGLPILAAIAFNNVRWSRPRTTRPIAYSLAVGFWLSLSIAWVAPIIPIGERESVYLEPQEYSDEVEPIRLPPAEEWNQFHGLYKRGIAHVERSWQFTSRQSTSPSATLATWGAETRLGFPFGCLVVSETLNSITAASLWRVLQFPVRWTGLIANWVFWSIVLLVTFEGPRLLIRGRRHRAVRCPNCGYDLQHEHRICPECGVSADRLYVR